MASIFERIAAADLAPFRLESPDGGGSGGMDPITGEDYPADAPDAEAPDIAGEADEEADGEESAEEGEGEPAAEAADALAKAAAEASKADDPEAALLARIEKIRAVDPELADMMIEDLAKQQEAEDAKAEAEAKAKEQQVQPLVSMEQESQAFVKQAKIAVDMTAKTTVRERNAIVSSISQIDNDIKNQAAELREQYLNAGHAPAVVEKLVRGDLAPLFAQRQTEYKKFEDADARYSEAEKVQETFEQLNAEMALHPLIQQYPLEYFELRSGKDRNGNPLIDQRTGSVLLPNNSTLPQRVALLTKYIELRSGKAAPVPGTVNGVAGKPIDRKALQRMSIKLKGAKTSAAKTQTAASGKTAKATKIRDEDAL